MTLVIASPHQALSRVPAEEKGVRVIKYPLRSAVSRHSQGARPLPADRRKPQARSRTVQTWLYREVLPSIRQYAYYASPGVKTGPTTDEMKEVLRAFLRDELPTAIAPIVLKAVRAHTDHAHQAELVRLLTGAVERLADLAVTGREQNELRGRRSS